MHEEVLRDFFTGKASTEELNDDLKNATVQEPCDEKLTYYNITSMNTPFAVEPEHLVKVCDAAITGKIPTQKLESIGFCLLTSDSFSLRTETRMGSVVVDTTFDWSAPQYNFPLTLDNIKKYRDRLLTGNDTFYSDDSQNQPT